MKKLKSELRKKLLLKRKSLSKEYIRISDELIYEKLIALEKYRNSKNIFCYVSMTGEVSTLKFLKKVLLDNKNLFIPLCLNENIIEARQIKSIDELVVGKFGILEPPRNSLKINLEEIDFSVIPCISANKNGYRLGYGGGYYDRFYKEKYIDNTFILCREQMIYEDIPIEIHDIKFKHVLTEKELSNKK